MTSAAVNNTAAGKAPINNKTLGIGMAAFAVIEAVVTFFLVMKPLFIHPDVPMIEYRKGDDSLRLIKRAQTAEEIFAQYVFEE